MGLDYYSVLGLTRSARDVDIKKSYRKLALKYHPTKDTSPQASQEFMRVCEAYDVLSNPQRKGFYDLHGEEALKKGKPDGNGGLKGGFYDFSTSDCNRVFAHFFGTDNPFEALEDLATTFQSLTANDKPLPGKMRKHEVSLTLEELYYGCLKKVTFQRKRINELDEMVVEDREVTIDVKPGLPEGTCFVFEGEGNRFPGKTPGPVVFVLKMLPHDRFSRSGADLIYKTEVPLYHALISAPIAVKLLNGTNLSVPVDNIITPGYQVRVPGQGLPDPSKGATASGDLVLKLDVRFPQKLSEAQKMLMKAAFFLPEEKEQCDAVKAFQKAFEDPLKGWQTGVSD